MYIYRMQYSLQHTISKPVNFEGIGLHSGINSKVCIKPSPENTGIIFKRVDHKDKNIIKADFRNVSSAKLCTTLKNQSGLTISTIEHLMAAFYITGIDNAIVEVDNLEIPIMDGSAKDFIKIIEDAGIVTQNYKRKFIKINQSYSLKEDNKNISIKPNNFDFDVLFELKYSNKVINNQSNHFSLLNDNLKDLYCSRTFCLYEDIEKIKKLGLAKGGSLENAIVVKNDKVLNASGLRNSKEFVNHKILDLVGDFMLSGHRIIGSVECSQGGHFLSISFLKKLLSDETKFTLVDFPNIQILNQAKTKFERKLAVNT